MLAVIMIDGEGHVKFDMASGNCSVYLPDAWNSHEVRIIQAGVSKPMISEDFSKDVPTLNIVLPPRQRETQIRISGRRYQLLLANPKADLSVRHTGSEETQDELVVQGVSGSDRPAEIGSLAIIDNEVEQPGIKMGHIVLDGIQTDSMLIHNAGDETGRPSRSLLTVIRSVLGGIPADARRMPSEFSEVGVQRLDVRRGKVDFNNGQRVLKNLGNVFVSRQ